MATNTQRKTAHDTLIRQETVAAGITKGEVADRLDDLSDDLQSAPGDFVDGATITLDMAVNRSWKGTIAGNRAIAFSNLAAGDAGMIEITQGGAGSFTVTWPGFASFPGGAITLATAVGATTIVGFYYNGSVLYVFQSSAGGGGGTGIDKPVVSFTANGTLTIGGGEIVTGILILPSTALTGFKIGTTAGGDDILFTQDLAATGQWYSIPVLFKATGSTTWYVEGVAGTVQIQLIKV